MDPHSNAAVEGEGRGWGKREKKYGIEKGREWDNGEGGWRGREQRGTGWAEGGSGGEGRKERGVDALPHTFQTP